jgi:REP element-mobilizing transposase RayT
MGLRKLTRPLSSRRPLHVVLRSARARGRWSMRTKTNQQVVRKALRSYAHRYGIKIYEFANAGNHLHLLLRSRCRLALQNFLRVFAGVTARRLTGARRGHPVGAFWEYLAYSRIVTWGRDFLGVRAYVAANENDGGGRFLAHRHEPTRKREPHPRE